MSLLKDVKFRPLRTILYPGVPTQTRDALPVTEVYQSLNIRMTGVVTTDPAVVPTGNTPEGALSFIRRLVLEGSSNKRRAAYAQFKVGDVAAMYNLQRFLRNVAGVILNPAFAAAATPYPMSFDLQLDFEMPHTSDPRRTYLNAAEDLETLTAIIDWGDGTDVHVPGAAATVASGGIVAQVVISGRELTDPNAKSFKYGVNTLSYQEIQVNAAVNNLEFNLRRGNLLRGVLIKAFCIDPVPIAVLVPATVAHTPVDDIILSARFLLNRETKIDMFDWGTLQGQNLIDFKMPALIPGYAFIDFMEDGNFNKIIPTNEFRDVTLQFNVQPSALSVAPLTAISYIRVYPIEIYPAMQR